MKKFDENKLAKLHSINDMLDKEYGKYNTESRQEFHEKAIAWYYGEILRERRKELKLTQQQLAEKVGKERSYIARIEKGETDMQISSLIRIAEALGLKFSLGV
ncbi:MAG: helix-turn-helix domain-containing protein [Bacteroidales bacterium]|jgi:ribosome-binding protein aMBF1 (putative translation factor)|nr:helix-turn-helix domain-containing protein [Bacteroidales bacterium]